MKHAISNTSMRLLSSLWLTLILIIPAVTVKAQTYVTSPVTGTITSGEYYHATSITIVPNTVISPGPGQSVRFYISGCVPLSAAPSSDQNYISTITPRIAGYVPGTAGYTTCDAMQTIQYLDGLGRPLQTVTVKGNQDASRDLIQPVEYDLFGREAKKYLPYTTASGNPGAYRPEALTTGQSGFYNQTGQNYKNIDNPYAVTVFEPSPLNRVTEQGAPGTLWQPGQHTTGVSYASNDAAGINIAAGTGYAARLYTTDLGTSGTHSLASSGNYVAGELYVTVTHDENYNGSGKLGTVEEYKDKEGHVVLKRTFNHNLTSGQDETLSTYYVYDDLGNLAFVLPPGSNADNAVPTADMLNKLCYQYNYDSRNRLVEKRIPGKDWEYMVYNLLDQVIFSQDGQQRTRQEASFTKYDAMGRVIMTGIEPDHDFSNGGRQVTQDYITNSLIDAAASGLTEWETPGSSITGYTNTSFPNGPNIVPLTINYYDDYSAPNLPSIYAMPAGAAGSVRSLQTASKIAVLNSDGSYSSNGAPEDMLWSVHYYDDKGRNIKTYQQHYLGGVFNVNNYDEISSSYDFTNAVTVTTRQHHTNTVGGAVALTIANTYEYDHLGRKVKSWEQINGGTNTLLSQTDYNEVGQLYTKHLHSTNGGSSFLQSITYAYNERGWLSQVNDPTITPSADQLFSLKLNYDQPILANNGTPQFNGNISEQLYNKGTLGMKFVTYKYDNLNRLIAGDSQEAISENSISYDQAGNIQGLQRFGQSGGPQILAYSYCSNSNQLQSVSSNNGAVNRNYGTYDANGNAPGDGIGHTISYNMLNLPRSISSGISYTYDATGQKLSRTFNGTTTYYVNGIQYTGTAIDFAQTEEGRVLNLTGTPNYEYTLTDHLGNNRVTFDPVTGKVGEEDYYPFGLNVDRQLNAGNKYLYNKKEIQDGLNGQYDYGARFYDPVIARWNTIDPLAERHTDLTPYNYVMNNPLIYGDELGMDTTKVLKEVKITAQPIKKDNGNEDAVGTNLFHHSYKPAPLPPCNCPLFKQAATFTAINLGLAALGEWVSKLRLFSAEATELSQEVKNIGPQKWIKIMNASHAWSKVAVSQGDIEAIISKTLQSGAEMPYGNTGLMSNVMYNNGEVIQVVKAQVNGQTVVSNAWVITDPAYKVQALRAIMADLH